jgi:hypothetical protein
MNAPQPYIPPVVDSPWFAMDEAAAYLKYRSDNAPIVVRTMLVRAGVPMYRRNGKALLVRRQDLDEWVETGDCVFGRRYQRDRREASETEKARDNPPVLSVVRRRGRPRKDAPPEVETAPVVDAPTEDTPPCES